MRRRKTVMVDIDNTLIRTAPEIIKELNRRLGMKMRAKDMGGRSFEEMGGEVWQAAKELFSNLFFYTRPRLCKGARAGLRLLQEKDYEIHIVTGRPQTTYLTTVLGLNEHKLLHYIDHLHLLPNFEDEVPFFKAKMARIIRPDAVFDDDAKTAEAVAREGFLVYLIRHSWNAQLQETENIKPVRSFLQGVKTHI